MVRATIEYDDADYELLRTAAAQRGVSVESLIVAESLKDIAPGGEDTQPFESWQAFFAFCDEQQFSLNGWKWNRDELYERTTLR